MSLEADPFVNKQLALRLIHPFSEGDEFTNGVTLDRIAIECDERDQRKDAIRLVFSSGIDLVIAHRSPNRAAFRTAHFSVSVQQSRDTEPRANQALIDRLRVLLTANDTAAPRHGSRMPLRLARTPMPRLPPMSISG